MGTTSIQVKKTLRISSAETNDDFRFIIQASFELFQQDNFQQDLDKYGAVTKNITGTGLQDIQSLIDYAKSSNEYAHFEKRFAPKGHTNKNVKKIREDITIILKEIDDQISNETVYLFLRNLIVFEYDADQDRIRIQEELKKHIPNDENSYSFLFDLIRKKAAFAVKQDRKSFINELSKHYKLTESPCFKAHINAIMQITRDAVGSITNTIGNVTISREKYIIDIKNKLKNNRLVQITGSPGVGKSVLLKTLIEEYMQQGCVFFLKYDRLSGNSWTQYAQHHQIPCCDLEELLIEIKACGTPILFIDGIDQIPNENRNVVLDIIRQILASDRLSDWKILTTIRDINIDEANRWIGNLLLNQQRDDVSLDVFDNDESEELVKQLPSLRELLYTNDTNDTNDNKYDVNQIVRCPFFIRIVAEMGITNTIRSELELMECWWDRAGYDASGQERRNRQQNLRIIAEIKIKNLSEDILLTQLNDINIDGLVRDKIIKENEKDGTIDFSHNIFLEWSLFYFLQQFKGQWLDKIIEFNQPPAIARVIELMAQDTFKNECWGKQLEQFKKTNLSKYFINKNAVKEKFKDTNLSLSSEAGIKAFVDIFLAEELLARENSAHKHNTGFLQVRSQWLRCWLLGPIRDPAWLVSHKEYIGILYANNFQLFSYLLTWFQADKTRPHPALGKQNVAYDIAIPSDIYLWSRFLQYLLQNISAINARLYPDILKIFSIWQNLLLNIKNPILDNIYRVVFYWLDEIENYKNIEKYKPIKNPKEFKNSLISFICIAAYNDKTYIEKYMQDQIKKGIDQDETIKELIKFSQILVQTSPDLLVEISLTYLKEPLPSELLQQDHAYYDRYFRRGGLNPFETELSLKQQGYFPPSITYEPFASLFTYAPDKALFLTAELLNHAITAWKEIQEMKEVHPIPIELDFPWGKQCFWGNGDEYEWYINSPGNGLISSMLMMLAKWAFAELEKGVPFDDLVKQILPNHQSIAILCIISVLALEKEVVSEYMLPLLTNVKLLNCDRNRYITQLAPLYLPFPIYKNPTNVVEVIQQLYNKQGHKRWLENLLPKYIVSTYQQKIIAGLQYSLDNLLFDYEEQKEDTNCKQQLEIETKYYASFIDLNNYKLQEKEDQFLIHYINPEAQKEENQEKIQKSNNHILCVTILNLVDQYFSTLNIIENIFDNPAFHYVQTIDYTDLFIQNTFNQYGDGDIKQANKQSAVAALASYVLCARESFSEKIIKWAKDVIQHARHYPISAYEINTLGQGGIPFHVTSYVIRAIIAEIKHTDDQDVQTYNNLLSALIPFLYHPTNTIRILAVQECFKLNNPKLIYAVLWGSLLLSEDDLMIKLYHAEYKKDATKLYKKHLIKIIRFYRSSDGLIPSLSLPYPSNPWIKIPEGYRESQWRENDFDWRLNPKNWDYKNIAQLLQALPVELMLMHYKQPFLEFVDHLLTWAIERVEPSWATDEELRKLSQENIDQNITDLLESLGSLIGNICGLLPINETKERFIEPILNLKMYSDSSLEIYQEFLQTYSLEYIYFSSKIDTNAYEIIKLCLDRFLQLPELNKNTLYPQNLSGFYKPYIAQYLMFIPHTEKNLQAKRYMNGQWSEFERFLPIIDYYIHNAGHVNQIIHYFLDLCSQAKEYYSVEKFVNQILALIKEDKYLHWDKYNIYARISDLIEYYLDQQDELNSNTLQNILMIIDWLIDHGDRHGAALQKSSIFKKNYSE
ncbi:ATP-binding protein [Commensalibacter papalotli (ex Botero et al. 2024)]|uniref:nSTAND3 domain-containing NTPase n=1 Tax=Commensalibacter papalotli (ex Botero et al. 2024) TaxID=2972766 RepID=UPI0024907BEE|nr:ATP-binding protein [Commensalibacter papalotli (ex Botero et al. 2024)]